MNFILQSYFLDFTIIILIVLNLIFIRVLKHNKSKIKENNNNNNINNSNDISNNSNSISNKDNDDYFNNIKDKFSKIESFKYNTIIFYIIVISTIIAIVLKIYKVDSYLMIFFALILIVSSKNIFKKNINDLTTKNQKVYILISGLFFIFLSSNTTQQYLKISLNILHTTKEYLLLIFLSIKIIFFIFCVITNISILASNTMNIFDKSFKKTKTIINSFINKDLYLPLYKFNLSNKYNEKFLIIDKIIFIITCPFILIIFFIFAGITDFLKLILKGILNFGNKLKKYLDNSNKLITKALKISLIFSLLIVYTVAIYNPNIISNNTKDVYELFTTVILIPFIYDSIKSK